SWRRQAVGNMPTGLLTAAGAMGALFLVIVLTQPVSRAEARTAPGIVAALRSIDRLPTDSPAHLALGVGFADAEPALARPALDAAVALNPASPGPRDTRAVLAAQLGDDEQALLDIEESMFRAPSRAQHPVLTSRAVAWLPAESRAATERGFGRAMDGAGYRAAVALAGFYSGVADRRAAAAAWEQAAELAPRRVYAASLLRRAGWELLQAQDLDAAEAYFRRAIDLAPADASARGLLIARVHGVRGELDYAAQQSEEGIRAGADAYEMDLALAEAGRQAGDTDLEIATLKRGIARQPADVRAHYRLGLAWFRRGDYNLAVPALEAASRVSPDYAPAWYYLAIAAERGYNFDLAGRAFERATAAAPANTHFRKQQQRFAARLENG
ncbi:MAG: tetratricopeptide repeat protein, partial [bacterium]